MQEVQEAGLNKAKERLIGIYKLAVSDWIQGEFHISLHDTTEKMQPLMLVSSDRNWCGYLTGVLVAGAGSWDQPEYTFLSIQALADQLKEQIVPVGLLEMVTALLSQPLYVGNKRTGRLLEALACHSKQMSDNKHSSKTDHIVLPAIQPASWIEHKAGGSNLSKNSVAAVVSLPALGGAIGGGAGFLSSASAKGLAVVSKQQQPAASAGAGAGVGKSDVVFFPALGMGKRDNKRRAEQEPSAPAKKA